MTPEEIDRTIEFLLDYAARIDSQIARLNETAVRHDAHLERLDHHLETLDRHLETLDRHVATLSSHIGRLSQTTDRFQVLATDIISVQSQRLDQHDELLRRIVERLP